MTQGTTSPAGNTPPRVTLNTTAFRAACHSRGVFSFREMGELLSLAASNVNRIVTGVYEPSPRFIASTLVAFHPTPFETLFKVEQ